MASPAPVLSTGTGYCRKPPPNKVPAERRLRLRRNIITWDRPSGRQTFQLFVNEPAPFTQGSIDYRQYDIFISHKGDDTPLAEYAGGILYENGLSVYLDRWDPAVDGDSSELESHLREIIRETPSILAVVTEHTPMSWWVPFELGVARETGSQIGTFLRVNEGTSNVVRLPSYLATWPILTSALELGAWASVLATAKYGSTSGTVFSDQTVRMSAGSYSLGGITRLASSGKVRFV